MRGLNHILHKFEVMQSEYPRQYCGESAGLMPEKVIHKTMDVGRVAHIARITD